MARNTPNVGLASRAAQADRRASANLPPVRTMPASQLQRITQLPAIQQTPRATPVGDGSGQVQYGAQTLDNPAPAPIADTSIETLRLTPEYMARERALANVLERFAVEQGTDVLVLKKT